MLKTKIVVSNSLIETQAIKSFSSFGEVSFNVLYKRPIELANFLLEKSGVVCPKMFVANDAVAALIYNDIKQIKFFELFTYNDVLSLVSTIQDMRYQIVENEKEKIMENLGNFSGKTNIFTEKNEAIIKAYNLIIDSFEEELIDEVGMIRFAIDNIKTFPNIDFVTYEYSHFRPLEKALINKAAGKEIEETRIVDDRPLKIERYTRCFGQNNEIEDILNFINENNIHFDECLIASTETNNYVNTLINYCDVLDIPVTIGTGRSLLSTCPGKLFSLIADWEKGHNRYEYLLRIIKDDSFNLNKFENDISFVLENLEDTNKKFLRQYKLSIDLIIETIGRLKISFDNPELNNKRFSDYSSLVNSRYLKDRNEQENVSRFLALRYIEKAIEIFNKGIVNFLECYAYNNDKDDNNALDKIKKMISFGEFGVPKQDIFNTLFSQNIGRKNPEDGKLYFTSIKNAPSALRKHLFVIGLSSELFPGKNRENPFLLDQDYCKFGVENASLRDIKENIENYNFLLDLANKYNCDICLSWPIYNSETLKGQNASSVILSTFQKENGVDKTIADFEKLFALSKSYDDKYREIEYFNTNLLNINKVGKEIAQYKCVNYSPLKEKENEENIAFEQLKVTRDGYGFSASAVTSYAECPYKFFMNYGLGMSQPQDINVYEVIPANEYGSLAHILLENLDKNQTSKPVFLKDCEKVFNEYLIINPIDNPSLVNAKKKEFLDMMDNAWEMESYQSTIIKEKNLCSLHEESGVKIHGLPDKVIITSHKNLHVIDYKTKNKIDHSPDKETSMIQCTMYSYLTEKKFAGYKVDGFEYRYLKFSNSVFSVNMEKHYKYLTNILTRLNNSIEAGEFSPELEDTGDRCYFKPICKYKNCCKKKG